MSFYSRIAILLLLSTCISACSHVESTDLYTTIRSSEKLNAGSSHQARPLVVYLYQLKTGANFEKSSFFALTEGFEETLGEDLIHKEEIEILPRQTCTTTLTLGKDTQGIGIVAAFHEIQHAVWKQFITIEPDKRIGFAELHVDLSSDSFEAKIK